MMNKSIMQAFTKTCLFSCQCLFKSVTVFSHAFSRLFSSRAYFQTAAYYRASTVDDDETECNEVVLHIDDQ